jgi:hypothetical protein
MAIQVLTLRVKAVVVAVPVAGGSRLAIKTFTL